MVACSSPLSSLTSPVSEELQFYKFLSELVPDSNDNMTLRYNVILIKIYKGITISIRVSAYQKLP